MPEQNSVSQLPSTNDHDAWLAYWSGQGLPWRTEPEIGRRRQEELSRLRTTTANIEQGVYPFKDEKLSRADIEWLLAHPLEDAEASKDSEQPVYKRLDVRGADLSGINLSKLPLSRLQAGLTLEEDRHATGEQSQAAAAIMERADLSGAHLESADLSRVILNQAILLETHLEDADLGLASLPHAILAGAHLEGANLARTDLEQATLLEAHLEGADLFGTNLRKANLLEAHLEGARLSGAHLEGATLIDTHLGGKQVLSEDHARIQTWKPDFPAILQAADLRGVFFGSTTHLDGIELGNEEYGFVAIADLHWDDVNLSVVNWKQLKLLGDEYRLHHHHNYKWQPSSQDDDEAFKGQINRQVAVMLRALEVNDAVIGYVFRSPVLTKKLKERLIRQQRAPEQSQKDRLLEGYLTAVRANRQLMVALQNQGLSEDADRFAYRAKVLQRQVLRIRGGRSIGQYIFSLFLDLLAGYGYKAQRTLLAYVLTLSIFALGYYLVGTSTGPAISPLVACLVSIASFHGRGLFPGGFAPSQPMAILGEIEAVIGLTIEISFIATFTQRFFGR
jgi:uncharacterized protein YjbI with pentapeptide repeats